LVPLLALGGCYPGVLNPAGPVAAGNRTILLNSLSIMLMIVVPTIVATLAFAWWFRAGNSRAKYRPTWSYSGRLELLVWSVPLLIVIFLAGIAWIGSHDLDPRRPIASRQRPLVVEVVALDWKWLFIYPEQGVASVNRLVIPAGRPIRFRITSGTVMNSFFVPRLGSQIYAMPGMETTLFLQADQPGQYRGISAQYSGPGFADMRFVADSVAPTQFATWATQAKAGSGPVLDGPGFLTLAKRSAASPVVTYRAVQPRLFEAILLHSGAPVRETQSGGREDRR
jgi:cytochrome o ubiquinol oxidase subunit 2